MINIFSNFINKFKQDKIFRNSIIISTFLILGQILSIYRERVLAQYVGVGTSLDIFNAAFRIPDLIYAVFAGFVITSTMVPYLSKDYIENNLENYNKKFNSSIFGYSFVIIFISILVVIFMPEITSLYISKDFGQDNFDTLVFLSRILMLQPVIMGLAIGFSTLGQMRDNFYTYLLGPILYTLSTIFGVVFFYNVYGLESVIVSVIFGAFLHLFLQLIHLRISKMHIHIKHFSYGYFKEHLKLALPRSGSYTATQIVMIVWTSFALSAGAGVLTAFTLAKKIFDVPLNIILSGIANSSVPALSKLYVSNNFKEFKILNNRNIKNVMIFSIVITFVLYVFSDTLISLIFGNIKNIELINIVLKGMSLVVASSAFNWYITSFFSSIKKPQIVFYTNASSVIFILCFTFILDKNIINFLYMFYFYTLYNSFVLLFFFWKEYRKML